MTIKNNFVSVGFILCGVLIKQSKRLLKNYVKKLKKTLDNLKKLCYNDYRKKEKER